MEEDDHSISSISSFNNDWFATATCQCGEVFHARDISRTIAEDTAKILLRIHIEESK